MYEIQQLPESRPTPGSYRRPNFNGAQAEQPAGRHGHYWREVSRSLGVAELATAVVPLGYAMVVVNRVTGSGSPSTISPPHELESACAVHVQMRQLPKVSLCINGQPQPVDSRPKDAITFYDLEQDYIAALACPYDTIRFYIPRAAFEYFAERSSTRAVAHLDVETGSNLSDSAVARLAACFLGVLDRPKASDVVAHHLALALIGHLAEAYGSARHQVVKGGLAPWQLRRAMDLMTSNLANKVVLAGVAKQCGLSPKWFARCFTHSMGMTPRHWLLGHRMEQAKRLLRGSTHSLAEIALHCGFADQSHFTRIFSAACGVSPGHWRRAHCDQFSLVPIPADPAPRAGEIRF
jgi:AraC-like DNA-binding protein